VAIGIVTAIALVLAKYHRPIQPQKPLPLAGPSYRPYYGGRARRRLRSDEAPAALSIGGSHGAAPLLMFLATRRLYSMSVRVEMSPPRPSHAPRSPFQKNKAVRTKPFTALIFNVSPPPFQIAAKMGCTQGQGPLVLPGF
jgi:hypothetical protein